jgi:hypothetical protein
LHTVADGKIYPKHRTVRDMPLWRATVRLPKGSRLQVVAEARWPAVLLGWLIRSMPLVGAVHVADELTSAAEGVEGVGGSVPFHCTGNFPGNMRYLLFRCRPLQQLRACCTQPFSRTRSTPRPGDAATKAHGHPGAVMVPPVCCARTVACSVQYPSASTVARKGRPPATLEPWCCSP